MTENTFFDRILITLSDPPEYQTLIVKDGIGMIYYAQRKPDMAVVFRENDNERSNKNERERKI